MIFKEEILQFPLLLQNCFIIATRKQTSQSTQIYFWQRLEGRTGFHFDPNASAPDCLFVSLHDVGVALVRRRQQ